MKQNENYIGYYQNNIHWRKAIIARQLKVINYAIFFPIWVIPYIYIIINIIIFFIRFNLNKWVRAIDSARHILFINQIKFDIAMFSFSFFEQIFFFPFFLSSFNFFLWTSYLFYEYFRWTFFLKSIFTFDVIFPLVRILCVQKRNFTYILNGEILLEKKKTTGYALNVYLRCILRWYSNSLCFSFFF